MKTPHLKIAPMTAAITATIALTACSPADRAPTASTFEAPLRTFMADGHDQLCLAMYDWPIDLTEAEAGAQSRHAVQLPVFEKLGLARSTIVPVPKSTDNPDGAIKRYELTDEGRKYYKAHAHTGRDGQAHQNDFCVAHITLDKVQGFELDPHDPKQSTATVSYSYRIEPAPWLSDPEAVRVLPMVARIVNGANGGLQMHQGFTRGANGWEPVAGPV